MRTVLKYANLLAVIGAAWMAIAVTLMRISPAFLLSLAGTRGFSFLVLSTELVFAGFLLFFFICLHLYNVRKSRIIEPKGATLAAVFAALWMFTVAALHRLPALWIWFATLASGLLLSVTQTFFILLFLMFLIIFYIRYKDGDYGIELRVSTVVAITGQAWFLAVSVMRLAPALWQWVMNTPIRRFMVITEPFVALSLLLFLIVFFSEPEA